MEIYSGFARVYDDFMDAPYEEWADYIEGLWAENKPRLVLDLACGTGSMIEILAARGYDMIGVDISSEMLAIARRKSPDVLLLNQDMRELELYGTVDAILCLCDSLNYILEPTELAQVFALVANYLNPGGLFIFDINSEYKFREVLADNNFSHVEDESAYIWENFYDEDSRLNEYHSTFFIKQGENYIRHEEVHIQRAYSAQEIKDALKGAGLTLLGEFEELSHSPPREASERIFFVAKKSD
ncbi:MAG: class I SAM-dependent methyltransferase [Clostridiales bacterium]|nr:class I SAM-dependent methyltransferase [Clostridiales bacterium]